MSGLKVSLVEWCKINHKRNLLDEWDYERNDIRPSEVAPMSNKKRWWKCNKGHSYEMCPNARCGRNRGCPVCSNQIVMEGENDLESLHPDIAREWAADENGDLCPSKVVCGSAKKVWWTCSRGHKYAMQINLRVQGLGCPYCSGHRVWSGFNDLETTDPELVLEWDYEKNTVSPRKVSRGSSQKVWWRCKKCGNEWEARIANRINGRKCPKCAEIERKEKYFSGMLSRRGSLAEQYPELLGEWDNELNSKRGLNPEQVLPGSKRKASWICQKCGRKWKAAISSRALNGAGCSVCSRLDNGQKHIESIIKSKGSLNENYPELVLEWDYEKNDITPDRISAGTGVAAWWICKTCGKSWKARVYSRTKGIGCPYCAKERNSSFPEQAVFYYISKVFPEAINGDRNIISPNELDIYIPTIKTAIEYDGQAFHKSVTKDKKKSEKCKEKGIRLIRIREGECPPIDDGSICFHYEYKNRTQLSDTIKSVLSILGVTDYDVDVVRDSVEIDNQYVQRLKQNSFANAFPEVAKEWNYERNKRITPEMVSYGSAKMYWWKCSLGHDYLSSPASRASGNGCPYCSKHKLLSGFNDFETCYPTYAKEWDYEKNYPLKPSQVIGGNKKIWWKCSLGHSYEATMNSRTNRNSGCPICYGRKVLSGYNDLATTTPELISEWDYEKNKGLTPQMVSKGSRMIVWWKCSQNHRFQMSITSKKKGNCPICNSKRIKVGFNDLATLYPEISKEWDYEKNKELKPDIVAPKSNKRVWWKCSKGHSYDTVICWKVTDNSGCPFCANQKILVGYNDMFSTNPELQEEWDFDKNTINPKTVSSGTNKKAWWICKECGFSWSATINSRKRGHGCPSCAKLRTRRAKLKPVINVETGEVFAGIAEAKKKYTKGNISKCLSGRNETAGGYHWRYMD